MLYSIFQQILNMSLTASAVIAVVLLLRPLFRRTPRALTYLLWAAVLFRLVCPVSFSADFALLFGFGTVNNRIQYLPTDLVRDSLPAALNTHAAQTAAPSVPIEAYTPYDLLGLAVMAGAWVWLAGIFVFLLVNAVSLVRLRRALRRPAGRFPARESKVKHSAARGRHRGIPEHIEQFERRAADKWRSHHPGRRQRRRSCFPFRAEFADFQRTCQQKPRGGP